MQGVMWAGRESLRYRNTLLHTFPIIGGERRVSIGIGEFFPTFAETYPSLEIKKTYSFDEGKQI